MKLIYTSIALYNRKQISKYISRNFGKQSVQDFNERVKAAHKSIKDSPFAHPKDWDLSTAELDVHFYIINGLTKMVYVVEDNQVIVLDIWDTRHQPPKSVSH